MANTGVFQGRVGLQQRVLPAYRAAFFDQLAEVCTGGLSVFAGLPRPDEAIVTVDRLRLADYRPARNIHLLRGQLYLCLQRRIIDWLEAWNPDALILEADPRCLRSLSAIRWMRRRGRPVLGWGLGGGTFHAPFSRVRRWARRGFLRRFDALIAYSTRGAEQYRGFGVPPTRVFTAANAVSPPPPPLPERPALEGRPPRILFVGRLQARKKVDLLLRACAAAPAMSDLWIVGDGPSRAELERLAAEVFPAARFFGALHGPPLERLFAQADLFILPGTGGLAVQEAMAHGLPVIVAEGDGTQNDLVRPGNGWLVPADDLTTLSDTLQDALSDPSQLRRMGAESHRIVSEEINTQAMVQVFVQALNNVTGMED